MVEAVRLVILSFCASVGFGLVFRLVGKDLLWAGLGAAMTRCVYLLLLHTMDTRLVYSIFAALFAALYAEFLATYKKVPSTVFLYPSIVPLIPGDLFYNTIAGFMTGDMQMVVENGKNCFLTLAGMSIGFVISSTVAHYIRRYRLGIHTIQSRLTEVYHMEKNKIKSK